MQEFSLGELQSLCVKATRGAGRAVGLAEEAGFAVRWLHARGKDGAGALVQLLGATDRAPVAELIPDSEQLTAMGRGICPLVLGGYLSDLKLLPTTPIGPVWQPLLMVPLVEGLLPQGVDIAPDTVGDAPEMTQLMPAAHLCMPSHSRAHISARALEALLGFAARTYAPATEQSRAGAGAGTTDND